MAVVVGGHLQTSPLHSPHYQGTASVDEFCVLDGHIVVFVTQTLT
jgi:hypothetical protein